VNLRLPARQSALAVGYRPARTHQPRSQGRLAAEIGGEDRAEDRRSERGVIYEIGFWKGTCWRREWGPGDSARKTHGRQKGARSASGYQYPTWLSSGDGDSGAKIPKGLCFGVAPLKQALMADRPTVFQQRRYPQPCGFLRDGATIACLFSPGRPITCDSSKRKGMTSDGTDSEGCEPRKQPSCRSPTESTVWVRAAGRPSADAA
jgi:hypothetical protein